MKSEIVDDRTLVEEVLKESRPLPDGVLNVDFELAEDHDGDPIVRINVHINADLQPSPDRISVLRSFSHSIRDRLLDEGIQRWPHIRLIEAKGGRL